MTAEVKLHIAGKLKTSPFTLSDEFAEAKQALHAYLHGKKSDSAVDEVMDVVIETGVFKVRLDTSCMVCTQHPAV